MAEMYGGAIVGLRRDPILLESGIKDRRRRRGLRGDEGWLEGCSQSEELSTCRRREETLLLGEKAGRGGGGSLFREIVRQTKTGEESERSIALLIDLIRVSYTRYQSTFVFDRNRRFVSHFHHRPPPPSPLRVTFG